LLNDLGYQGWELIYYKNQTAFLMNHATPIRYQYIKNPEYVNDYTTVLNNLGLDDWIFVDTRNGYTIFKQFPFE
jgi:hypothetical protein